MDTDQAFGRTPSSRGVYWGMSAAAGVVTGALVFYPFAWYAGTLPVPPLAWPALVLVQSAALAWWTRTTRPGRIAVGLLMALCGLFVGFAVAMWLFFAVSNTPEV